MSELTVSNHRYRAQNKCVQTVVGQRFAGNGPNGLSYCYYYYSILIIYIYIYIDIPKGDNVTMYCYMYFTTLLHVIYYVFLLHVFLNV